MRAYFWSTENGTEFYYVPSVILSVFNGENINFLHEPDTLEKINLAFINKRINRETLIARSREFYCVELKDRLIRRFISSCENYSRKKTYKSYFRLEDLAENICRKILDYVESREQLLPMEEIEAIDYEDSKDNDSFYKDSYYNDYDIDDYDDDWWLRGEKPPYES